LIDHQRYVQSNTRRTVMRDYRDDVEAFLVYCPSVDGIYCVPVEEVPIGYMSLRIEPTRNGQAHRVRWAADYELPA
jgi:hypothetical protein